MSASIVIPNFVKDPRRSYTDCLTEDDLLVISLAITEFCAAKEAARNNGMTIDPLVVSPRSGRIQRSAHRLAAVLGWPRVMIEAAFQILVKKTKARRAGKEGVRTVK